VAFVPQAWSQDEDCEACHENITRSFAVTAHGRLAAFETIDGKTGCVTCHGDGAKHMESGDANDIRRFTSEATAEDASDTCRECHRSLTLNDWETGAHALNGVGCSGCHRAHAPPPTARNWATTVCLPCHREVNAQFRYPSHHPVLEGHMTCIGCHHPHGTSIGMLNSEERPAEVCFDCHAGQAGPFLFEHDPVMEGCDTCHAPHGSAAPKLLVQNEPFICLQCHEFHFHAGLEAEEDTEAYVPRYDPTQIDPDDGQSFPGGLVPNPWGPSGYKRAFTTKCTQCHTQVHGSDNPSQAVPGFGRGLMR
jgi:DmsE family decaheme c-type cytochrome